MSTNYSNFENLNITIRNDYAIVQMNRGKVNALNLELLKDLIAAFAQIESDSAVRGMILTGQTNYFSAGVDIVTMMQSDDDYYLALWSAFQQMSIDLVKFSKPAIAAINGHSPAGGCVMAVACDYRFMVDGPKYRIGLNEVRVGIPIPDYVFALYSYWVGKGNAHHFLMEGKMLNCTEAHQSGLIDQLVSAEALLETAEAKMQHILEVPDSVLRPTKYTLRKDLIDIIDVDYKAAMQERLKQWQNPVNKMQMIELVSKLRAK